MNRRSFVLSNSTARNAAMHATAHAPEGYRVEIREPKRTDGQNDKFHAICSDLAKSKHPFAGKPRSQPEWKVLLVSGHAVATKEGAEMIPGIEGEFVNLRQSTALMSVRRSASLIEYAQAFCADIGLRLSASPEMAETA